MGIHLSRGTALLLVLVGLITSHSVLAADSLSQSLGTARDAYEKGNLVTALQQTEASLAALVDKLGTALLPTLPAPLPGWTAEQPEILGLGQVGGGLSISRVYTKGDATLNVTLILDNQDTDALDPIAPEQPNTSKLKVGDTEALLRFDPSLRSGEVIISLSPRLRLEIQGDDLDNAEPLRAAASGWNIALIRKVIGG